MSVVILSGTTHVEDDFSLDPEVIASLWRMEERHFWHAARNRWIGDLLTLHGAAPPARMLEVGCGSGAVAGFLQASGYRVTGVDTAERLVRKAAERCAAATFIVGDVDALPSEHQGPYAVVGFFDVLEHLDSPEHLLRSALRWACDGAVIIATVPALRSLHSTIDDLSGHKRRYERGELSDLFAKVGIRGTVEHGIFRATLPVLRMQRLLVGRNTTPVEPVAIRRTMRDNFRVPAAPINQVLGLVAALERRIGLNASRNSVGASLVAVGRYTR